MKIVSKDNVISYLIGSSIRRKPAYLFLVPYEGQSILLTMRINSCESGSINVLE